MLRDLPLARLREHRAVQPAYDFVHFIVFAIRRFVDDRMNLAAGALTYSTLLALVPLVVIAFAILSSFPAFDAVKGRMEELFLDAVVPEVGANIRDYLSDFTQNASDLTTVGVIGLAVAALLLLSTIEDTLNQVWRVERPRPMLVRFLIFWTILTLGPLLIGASFTLTTDFLSAAERFAAEDFGVPRDALGMDEGIVLGWLLRILIKVLGFTLLFTIVPARRVRLRHAVIGGIFAGVAFEALSWGFNTFLTSGTTYETIYGAVAAVPIFLVWIWTSWTVIILGAVFAASFPDWWMSRSTRFGEKLEPPHRLEAAVALLSVLHENAAAGGTTEDDALSSAVPLEARGAILDRLLETGYVVETDAGFALARDLHRTSLAQLSRDLGLRLGRRRRPEEETDETLGEVARRTGSLPHLLSRLADSEDEILDTALSEVFQPPEKPATAPILGRVGGSD